MASCQKINVFSNQQCYENNQSQCGENDLNLLPLKEVILNIFFPVGAIYMDASGNLNPNTQFGGTWVKIQNAFLYGSGSKSVGTTGGAETVTLTVNQLPSHNHGVGSIQASGSFRTGTQKMDEVEDHYSGIHSTVRVGNPVYAYEAIDTNTYLYKDIDTYLSRNRSGSTGYAGDTESHENMPPYLVVNIWKRIA